MRIYRWLLIECCFILLMLIMSSSVVKAAKLTVLTDYPNAFIYLNNEVYGKGELNNRSLEEGLYQLRVDLNGEVVYRKDVNLKNEEKLVIDTTGFTKPKVVSFSEDKNLLKRAKKLKGNVAVGLMYGQMSGYSLKWRPFSKLGVHFIGGNFEIIDNKYSFVHSRILYTLNESLTFNDNLKTSYFGLGYGRHRVENTSKGIINVGEETEDRDTLEYVLGIEFPVLGAFASIELSYLVIDSSINKDRDALGINVSIHGYI